jgi:hypothetical protein
MGVSALLALFGGLIGSFNWISAFTGLAIGVVFIMTKARGGEGRFYILGGLSIFLGLAFAFIELPESYSLGLFYGSMGVAAMISGGLTLARYLRENPMPKEESNE